MLVYLYDFVVISSDPLQSLNGEHAEEWDKRQMEERLEISGSRELNCQSLSNLQVLLAEVATGPKTPL